MGLDVLCSLVGNKATKPSSKKNEANFCRCSLKTIKHILYSIVSRLKARKPFGHSVQTDANNEPHNELALRLIIPFPCDKDSFTTR